MTESLPVAVIGAGPVGLAAAAHLVCRGLSPLVFESGPSVGTALNAWGHVRVFSPWSYNVDEAARSLLTARGWNAPNPKAIPLGREIVTRYLEPLAALPSIAPHTLYEPAFAVVARRSGSSGARAGITALTLWGGFASTVFIPIVQHLLDTVGWRGTLMVLGGVNLVLCATLYALVIDPRADHPERTAPVTSAMAESGILRWVMRLPAFWALAVALTAYYATFSAFTFHFYPLLIERGFDTGTVVAAMAIIGPAQVAGRIAIWVFAPKASVRLIGSAVVLVFPLALLALQALPPSFTLVAVVAALYGCANGIMTIVRGLAVPEMLTREAYGAVNGALAAPGMIARAIAPVAAASIWASTGSYNAVVIALVIGACVLVVGFWSAALLSSRASRAHI